jgi:hypothetical protein
MNAAILRQYQASILRNITVITGNVSQKNTIRQFSNPNQDTNSNRVSSYLVEYMLVECCIMDFG